MTPKQIEFDRMFILELANNHMGDVEHGIKTIRVFADICRDFNFQFAFKLQYRNLETFIHPEYKGRKDIKYVKRFEETYISEDNFKRLKDEIINNNFIAICTPFDEKSVDLIEKHQYDIIKIGSCSFTDWPLLERIVQTNLPIIASTASATLEEIDRVITFFEHRNKKICIMHCVGEYPTLNQNLQLNQISFLRKCYPEIAIGFSTHEEPDNFVPIKIAIAKGAKVFERHVALETEKYRKNSYSSTPEQIKNWLIAASEAFEMNGVEDCRYQITEKEKADLRGLKRGVFAKNEIKAGEKLSSENIFFAIPCGENQLLANDISKYIEYTVKNDIQPNRAVEINNVKIVNLRDKVLSIIKDLKEIILKSHIILPDKIDLELSHHYGIDKYYECGAAILNCINREYCKKLIILLPGQKHPMHYHLLKEETFHVLYGSMAVCCNDKFRTLKAGDMLTVERNTPHNFETNDGVIFEEVSTTHYKNDSFYNDENIMNNKDRKTELTFRAEWLYKHIK